MSKELLKAFRQAKDALGNHAAVRAILENVAGVTTVARVPADKVAATVKALNDATAAAVSKSVHRTKKNSLAATRRASVPDSLDAMARKIFSDRRAGVK